MKSCKGILNKNNYCLEWVRLKCTRKKGNERQWSI